MKIVYGLLAAVAAFAAWQMVQALRFPPELIERAELDCVRWIGAEFAQGRGAAANGHWIKRGRIVVEVLVDRPSGNISDVVLCVFDPESGDLLKPSVFDAQNWR